MASHVPAHELPVDQAPHLAQILLWLLLAGVGGGVKYISAVIKSPEQVSNRRFLALLGANMLISSFCGLMGFLLATTFTVNWAVHGLVAGCVGYMGTQGMDLVLLSLKRKIGTAVPIGAVIPMPAGVDQSPPAA